MKINEIIFNMYKLSIVLFKSSSYLYAYVKHFFCGFAEHIVVVVNS